jgi:phosphate transport system substrate-binding protein
MKTYMTIRKVLGFAVALALVGPATGVHAANITIKGSDTMVILAQRWAETYMKQHPDVTIQVTGGGSGTGIAALINKTTNLANSSRPIKGEEIAKAGANGVDPGEFKVALDALAVVVGKGNPVKELSMQQLNGIYRGDINDWSEVGGKPAKIIRYCRESNSGTYVFVKEHVLQNADYAADCQTMPGTSAVAEAVSRDPNGIGYGGVAYFAALPAVKVLPIKKTDSTPAVFPLKNGKPDYEVVWSGEYPISRWLYIYTTGKPSPEEKAYLDWIMGPAGQQVVADVEYVPLKGVLQPQTASK